MAGVSGMTATVLGAVTRKNVRVAPDTAFSASSSEALRRSTVIGGVAKGRIEGEADVGEPGDREEDLAALASRKTSDVGILTF